MSLNDLALRMFSPLVPEEMPPGEEKKTSISDAGCWITLFQFYRQFPHLVQTLAADHPVADHVGLPPEW